ncbi:MAG: hypothetical protein V5A47_04960 [Bacteroidales bacterium]
MKTYRLILALFGMAMVVFTSCENDNDLEKPTLQLEFETVTSGSSLKSTAANSIEFTSGHIILENVEFQTESETDSVEVDFEIDSYITLDFATGETDPDLSYVEIVPGNYTEIEIEVELWDQNDQPSIDLSGTWTNENGTELPVRLLLPVGQTFSLEQEGEFTIGESTSVIARITFDPNAWFAGDAGELLPEATKNEEGVIVVSPDQNPNIYDIIKDAIDRTSEVEIEM